MAFSLTNQKIELVQPIGFKLDSYSFGVHDVEFLANAIINEGIKTLLEVGCGISSLLLSQLCHVTTLENDPKWADKVSAAKRDIHDLDVVMWDGKKWPVKGRWDAVFIDGPEELDPEVRKKMKYVGLSREPAFQNAPDLTDRVFVHDACRFAEMMYQLSYLAKNFRVTEIIKSDDWNIPRYLTAWRRIENCHKETT